ncbi:aryl-alcohol dehydrogenase [Xylariomycetidae sp. FL2044]|nr:aryl-alcohol dehydrogenase [Xylariomycetidae sp. FL2044]
MDVDSYDFLIVGGGTAGLVIASRLSEDPTQRVMVLEAGKDRIDDPRVRTPAFYQACQTSDTSWCYQTEPQALLNGRSVGVNQGKVLGGSSATNAHAFVPPTPASIDAWEALGNNGWNWKGLEKYFHKMFTPPVLEESWKKPAGIGEWAGARFNTNGPVRTSFACRVSHPLREAWRETFKSKGYTTNDPFFHPSTGSFSCLNSIDPATSERCYSATAYYQPIKDRENLVVVTDALVEKVVFSETADGNTRAAGVRYLRDGKSKDVAAAKEVIITAGCFQSPKILELSGIGDKDFLADKGIEVINHLPGVGENLQEHVTCGISFELREEVETLDALLRQEPDALSKAMEEYTLSRTGPLSSTGITTFAYLPVMDMMGREGVEHLLERYPHLPVTGPEELRARIYRQIYERTILDRREPTDAYLTVLCQGLMPTDPDSGFDSPTGPVPGNWLNMGSFLSQPLSRGSVHIKSADPSVTPAIDPRYFSNPIEFEVFARHMLYLNEIVSSPPMTNLLKQPRTTRDPASVLNNLDDAKRYLTSCAGSIWHPCGSCSMLPLNMNGLRVADASVFPLIPNANTQTTVYAVSEKAADIIKTEYGLK